MAQSLADARRRRSCPVVLFLSLSIALTVLLVNWEFSFLQKRKPYVLQTPQAPQAGCPGHAAPANGFGSPYVEDRGEFVKERAVLKADDHPLSAFDSKGEREAVIDWVVSFPSECLKYRLSLGLPLKMPHVLTLHTSMEGIHKATLLNHLVALQRTGFDVSNVLVVLYLYEEVPAADQRMFSRLGIKIMTVWDFEIPHHMLRESKLTVPQIFFIRNVINLKLLKLGYHVLQADSDVIFLNQSPLDEFSTTPYAIEAATGFVPTQQSTVWGRTLNCGLLSLKALPSTVSVFENMLVFGYDFEGPVDQWHLNYFLERQGAVFDSHRTEDGSLVRFTNDSGPLTGSLAYHGRVMQIRVLDLRMHLTGRWLSYLARSNTTFAAHSKTNDVIIKSVHPTHLQGDAYDKVDWFKSHGLWFLKDSWEDLIYLETTTLKTLTSDRSYLG